MVSAAVIAVLYVFGSKFGTDPDTPEGYAKRYVSVTADIDPERDYQGNVQSGALFLKTTVTNDGPRDLEDVALRVYLRPEGKEMDSKVVHLGSFRAGEKHTVKKSYQYLRGRDSADGSVTYINYEWRVEIESVEFKE